MFRGGPVSSYGTGIASGLADGGRVGLANGGAPFNVNPGARTPIPTQSTMQTGASLLDRARNIPYLGRLIPSAGGRLAAMSPFGLAALGGIGIGKTADFITRATDTPEAYAFRKEATRANPFLFDETSTDEFEEFSETLREKDQGEKFGFFPQGGPEKRLKEMKLEDQFTVEGDRIVTPPKKEKPGDTGTGGTGGTGGRNNNDPEEPIISAEDAIRENAELFKELLGEASKEDIKKARIQDASDYALKFFAGTQKEGADVGSAAAEVAEFAVSRDSRTDRAKEAAKKTDQTAVALAINDYVAGKRSKEDIQKALALNAAKIRMAEGTLGDKILKAKGSGPVTVTVIRDVLRAEPEYSGKSIEEFNSKDKDFTGLKYAAGDEDKIFIDTITKETFIYSPELKSFKRIY